MFPDQSVLSFLLEVMDQKQQKSRQTATQKFMHSLYELETVLQSEEDQNAAASERRQGGNRPATPAAETCSDRHDSNFNRLLDDAVQDIEQFMAEPPRQPDS